jgi:transposase-like protein
MKLHGNARTCLHSRLLIVRRVLEDGWTLTQAAEAAGVSVRTVSKWLRRYREEGEQALLDRSSAPRSVPIRGPRRTAEPLDPVTLRPARPRGHPTPAKQAGVPRESPR